MIIIIIVIKIITIIAIVSLLCSKFSLKIEAVAEFRSLSTSAYHILIDIFLFEDSIGNFCCCTLMSDFDIHNIFEAEGTV